MELFKMSVGVFKQFYKTLLGEFTNLQFELIKLLLGAIHI